MFTRFFIIIMLKSFILLYLASFVSLGNIRRQASIISAIYFASFVSLRNNQRQASIISAAPRKLGLPQKQSKTSLEYFCSTLQARSRPQIIEDKPRLFLRCTSQ